MSGKKGWLRCGELAQLTGVSPDTVRHYERMGILAKPPRTAGGYRMYGRDAIDRVCLARRALQLGFTLSELSEILKVRGEGEIPCHRVLRLAEGKLRSLERQIEELRRTQRYMKQLVQQWRAKLGRTKPGNTALLLHSLAGNPSRSANPVNRLKRRKRS